MVENFLADVTAVKWEEWHGGFPPDMERVRAKPTPLNLDPGRIRRGGLAEAAYADENGTLPPDAFTPPG